MAQFFLGNLIILVENDTPVPGIFQFVWIQFSECCDERGLAMEEHRVLPLL